MEIIGRGRAGRWVMDILLSLQCRWTPYTETTAPAGTVPNRKLLARGMKQPNAPRSARLAGDFKIAPDAKQ